MCFRKAAGVVVLLQLFETQIGTRSGSPAPEWASPQSRFAAVRGFPAGPQGACTALASLTPINSNFGKMGQNGRVEGA